MSDSPWFRTATNVSSHGQITTSCTQGFIQRSITCNKKQGGLGLFSSEKKKDNRTFAIHHCLNHCDIWV